MVCFHPVSAYRSKVVNPSGKRSLVYSITHAYDDGVVKRACGSCLGCRLEYSRQWAVRCVHESSMFTRNCFITLTYAPEHLPLVHGVPTLVKNDFALFMKRLRKHNSGIDEITYMANRRRKVDGVYVSKRELVTASPVRFYHCGEYGDKTGRPHYHASMFNFDVDDKEQIGVSNGYPLYSSAKLQKLWPFGYVTVAPFTFKTAAYVARYVMKKVNGEVFDAVHSLFDTETGEFVGYRQGEYATMSRSPGIGRIWYDSYKTDVYPSDFVVVDGRKIKPPKYYDNLYAEEYPFDFDDVKYERYLSSLNYVDNNTSERLLVREACKQASIDKLVRGLG